jgi:putative Ca2+/H+ antiporter (TMEM165/GDT1 family)
VDFKIFVTIFGTVFLAEIADKTQLATLLFAADEKYSKLLVFAASALALLVATAIAVAAGTLLSQWVDEKFLGRLAGIAFILVGVWTLVRA